MFGWVGLLGFVVFGCCFGCVGFVVIDAGFVFYGFVVCLISCSLCDFILRIVWGCLGLLFFWVGLFW